MFTFQARMTFDMKVRNEPTWVDEVKKGNYPQLDKNIEVDIAVIGGGLTGILTAYLLSKQKKLSVALAEKGEIAGEKSVTAYTTAHLTGVIDTDFSQLIEMFGKAGASKVWKSHNEAIDLIEEIAKKEKIDCEFKRVSAYRYINTEDEQKNLQEEFDSLKQLKIKASLHLKNKLPIKTFGYIEFQDQAEFHPIKFIQQLAQIAYKNGVQMFQNTEVTDVNEQDKQKILATKSGSIVARNIVYATYWPFRKHRDLFAKKGEYTTYVIEAKLPKRSIPEGLYWDIENPYHYTRIDSYTKFDRVIIGGEDHRVELPIDEKKNFKALEDYTKQMLDSITYQITRRWTGPILEPLDGLAMIGELRDHEFIGTGYSGNGMTYSVIAAQIFSDILTRKKNPYVKLYDPHRLPGPKKLLKKGRDYTEEFLGGAAKNLFK